MITLEKNLAWIREQNRREEQAIKARKQRARKVLPTLVQCLLQRDPGISKIILFGSLARNDERLRLDFDIDLAVDCSPEKYYSLVSLMLDVTEFNIDLLDFKTTTGLLKHRILEEGIILYEK
jgi:predicted nucleotidyltransferase